MSDKLPTAEDARRMLDAATQGRMRLAIMDPERDPVEHFRESLSHGSGDVWGVMAVDHPRTIGGMDDRPEHGVMTCWTGNGPTSEANAELYVAAPGIARALIAMTEERDYCKLLAEFITGERSMPVMRPDDDESDDGAVRLRSWMMSVMVREMGRMCIDAGGENNVSLTFHACSEDHEFAGYQFEVHVTKPGGKTPGEQKRTDVETEIVAWLRAKVSDVAGDGTHRGGAWADAADAIEKGDCRS